MIKIPLCRDICLKLELDMSSVLTLQGIPNCGQHKEQTVVLDEFGHECGRFN